MNFESETSKKLSKNESIKEESRYLRGTILEGLADSSTGAISADDAQLTKFHGTYLQDDRDFRKELLSQKQEKAFSFMNALKLVDISNNLGDTKSLTTHPATTTHQRISGEERSHLGITDGFVRLSIGLEDVEDLKEDIAQALSKV